MWRIFGHTLSVIIIMYREFHTLGSKWTINHDDLCFWYLFFTFPCLFTYSFESCFSRRDVIANNNFGNSYYHNEKLCHGRRLVEWSNTKKINWMCEHGARFSTAVEWSNTKEINWMCKHDARFTAANFSVDFFSKKEK